MREQRRQRYVSQLVDLNGHEKKRRRRKKGILHLSACCTTETPSSARVHNDSRPGTLPEKRHKCFGHEHVGCNTVVEVEVGALLELNEMLSFGQLKARSVINEHY